MRFITQQIGALLILAASVLGGAGCGSDRPRSSSSSGDGGDGGQGGDGKGGAGQGGASSVSSGMGGAGGDTSSGVGGAGGSGVGGAGGGAGVGGAGGAPPDVCGDGVIGGAEACDDGNMSASDGCSDTCAVETGYACNGTPSTCSPKCGDNMIIAPEACDDGDMAGGDGCSATCTVENGFICSGTPSNCSAICGDSMIVGAEACDDGDMNGGDGCSATCTVESGYSCGGVPSNCSPLCGDGMKVGNEICDGANLGGATCQSLGFVSGALTCGANCMFNTSGCVGPEVCNNNIDDDLDNATDCADSDCGGSASCGTTCASAIPLKNGVAYSSTTVGGPAVFSGTCIIGNAPERIFSFTPGMAGQTGNLTVELQSATDQAFYIRTACADSASQLGCTDDYIGGTNEMLTIPVQGGVPLTIIVDGYLDASNSGPFTIAATFVVVAQEANCSNGLDDNSDGNVDCADVTCVGSAACTNPCASATPLTSGVPVSGTTVGGPSLNDPTCGISGGLRERYFKITPGVVGQTVELTVVLESATDQGISVQTTCGDSGTELGCEDAVFGGTDETLVVTVPGGQPLTIVADGYSNTNQAGPFTITATTVVVICGNGTVEGNEECDPPNGTTCDATCQFLVEADCANSIDDEGDGATDCADSDCAGDPACSCAGATALSDGVPYSGTTVGGSAMYEGTCTGGSGSFEQLFTFTPGAAGQNGNLTIVLESATDQGIYVLGTCGDTGTQIACRDAEIGGTDEVLTIPVQGGVPLEIVVDGYFDPSTAGPFTITATFTVPESLCSDALDNDGDTLIDCADPDCGCGMTCASPVPLSDGVPFSGTTVGGGATEAGTCLGTLGAFERIFSFTPGSIGQTGDLIVVLESNTDQGIYVRSTCGDSGSELACVDDQSGGFDEFLSVPVTGGVPLTIIIDGYNDPVYAGPFTVTASFTAN